MLQLMPDRAWPLNLQLATPFVLAAATTLCGQPAKRERLCPSMLPTQEIRRGHYKNFLAQRLVPALFAQVGFESQNLT